MVGIEFRVRCQLGSHQCLSCFNYSYVYTPAHRDDLKRKLSLDSEVQNNGQRQSEFSKPLLRQQISVDSMHAQQRYPMDRMSYGRYPMDHMVPQPRPVGRPKSNYRDFDMTADQDADPMVAAWAGSVSGRISFRSFNVWFC